MATTEHPVDMTTLAHQPVRNDENKARQQLPVDVPAYLGITRHLSDTDPKALLGWSVIFDSLSHKAEIKIKIGRGNGPLVILVDGQEVHRITRSEVAP